MSTCWYQLQGHDLWHAWPGDAPRDDYAYAPQALSLCAEIDGAVERLRMLSYSYNFLTIPTDKLCPGCAGVAIPAIQRLILNRSHTCSTGSRATCRPCLKFQGDLWDAINRYVVACGGDAAVVNDARMDAVVAVNTVIRRAASDGDIR